MKLSYTRAIVDAIHSGELAKVETKKDAVFGFEVPTSCPGVPNELLWPKNTWSDKGAYDETASKLASLFSENFKKFAEGASAETKAAGPKA